MQPEDNIVQNHALNVKAELKFNSVGPDELYKMELDDNSINAYISV